MYQNGLIKNYIRQIIHWHIWRYGTTVVPATVDIVRFLGNLLHTTTYPFLLDTISSCIWTGGTSITLSTFFLFILGCTSSPQSTNCEFKQWMEIINFTVDLNHTNHSKSCVLHLKLITYVGNLDASQPRLLKGYLRFYIRNWRPQHLGNPISTLLIYTLSDIK